jgi:magnesium transporter
VEYAQETNLSLQSLKDNINALHEANSTLVEYRVNEILKVLTIFSVIVFPLTLIAALFGMNTQFIPLIGSPYDFWKIIGIMAGGAMTMLGIFKWKRWI